MADHETRAHTKAYLETMGIPLSENLPVIDFGHLRNEKEIMPRLMCLHATAAVAHGFASDQAIHWLETNDLIAHCTSKEIAYLRSGIAPQFEQQTRVEALYALFWMLGFDSELLPLTFCPNTFVQEMPDLRKMAKPDAWHASAKIRETGEVAQMLDIYFALSWALNDNGTSMPNFEKLTQCSYVIRQRRHALEWALSDEDWDEISSDT